MKQITDKLNKIAKAIDESVELPSTDLIIDSLDAITKAFGGTPNDSNLIVDKLDDIAAVASKGGGGGSSEVIPEQTVTFETTEMGTTAELSGVTLDPENPVEAIELTVTLEGTSHTQILAYSTDYIPNTAGYFGEIPIAVVYVDDKWLLIANTSEGFPESFTISAVVGEIVMPKCKLTIINETDNWVPLVNVILSGIQFYTNNGLQLFDYINSSADGYINSKSSYIVNLVPQYDGFFAELALDSVESDMVNCYVMNEQHHRFIAPESDRTKDCSLTLTIQAGGDM